MCLPIRQLDPKTRRIMATGYFCLASNYVTMLFYDHGFGHRHPALFDGLRFLLLGCAIGLLFWFARRRHSACAPRP